MEINFLKSRRKQLTDRQQRDRRFFQYAAIGLGIIFTLFVVALGVRLWLAYSIGGLQTRQEQLKQQIASLEDNERSYVIFVTKLQILTDLFGQRKNKQEAITYFSSLFDDRVLIKDITYQAEDNLLAFGVEANSVFTLEEVFSRLSDPEVKERFAELNRSELKRDVDGSYSIQVTVVLKQ